MMPTAKRLRGVVAPFASSLDGLCVGRTAEGPQPMSIIALSGGACKVAAPSDGIPAWPAIRSI